MSVDTEIVAIEEIVGDLEVPCDYDRMFRCGPSAAEWEMRAACGCGDKAVRLVCTDCKEAVLKDGVAVACPSDCGTIHAPARRVFWFIGRI